MLFDCFIKNYAFLFFDSVIRIFQLWIYSLMHILTVNSLYQRLETDSIISLSSTPDITLLLRVASGLAFLRYFYSLSSATKKPSLSISILFVNSSIK